MGSDIVSTSREILEKFIKELHGLATHVKILVIGAPSSAFYNIYVAGSVTAQGRSYISCSIMLFESLLANNVKFNSLNEIIIFIHNVIHEKQDRKLDDNQILDRNITREECFYKLLNTVDPLIWIPTEVQMKLLWERLEGVSQEDINRIYYKNNLYTFCELPVLKDLIVKILKSLKEPFMDPNSPPDEIKNDLEILVTLIKEYVYYPHIYIDKCLALCPRSAASRCRARSDCQKNTYRRPRT